MLGSSFAGKVEESGNLHIRVVAPVLDSPGLVGKAKLEYEAVAAPGTTISVVPVARGTNTIENEFDAALAAPEVMRLVRDAEAEGVDACVIGCFGDPGMIGARELVSIPVVGEGEAGLLAAAALSMRFSVMITEKSIFPFVRRLVDRQGLGARLASVRGAGAGVMDLNESCVPRIVAECVDAVERDGAEAFVMGCTGTGFDMAITIERALSERFGCRVPVIDPAKVALKLTEGLVSIGLSHSKLTYPTPLVGREEYPFA